MNYRKATLAITVLAAGMGLLVWQMHRQQKPDRPVAARSDYRMQEFLLQAFGEDGDPAFSLKSPLLERSIDGKSIEIERPLFEFPDSGGGQWLARADTAWVSDRAREVQLRDNVVITGPVSAQGLETEIRIERISVFPKEKRMASDRRVTIRHGTSILAGTGLDADMDQRRIRLLSEVNARYVPSSR